MDIGEIEKIGDRELPGVPTFPKTLPLPTPAPQVQPERAPAKAPEKEKVPA